VISISYVWNEAEFPAGYLRQQCLEYLKLGLRGVTVVAASGDWGVADQRSRCIDPSTGNPVFPGNSNHTTKYHFSTGFPASCPWVTAVGGTSFVESSKNPQPSVKSPSNSSSPFQFKFPPQRAYRVESGSGSGSGSGGNESADDPQRRHLSTSGGGFSRVFPRPEYQSEAVAGYLSSLLSNSNSSSNSTTTSSMSKTNPFNPAGRGYPDVALLAQNYLVVYDSALYTIDGTSAAAPVFAAMIARINSERVGSISASGGGGERRRKKTVGFLNPVLYSSLGREIFEDVKIGGNEGCGFLEEDGGAFAAREGWDAVTGLGAVRDFERLRGVLVGLP